MAKITKKWRPAQLFLAHAQTFLAEIGNKRKYKSVELSRTKNEVTLTLSWTLNFDQSVGKKSETKKNSNHHDQPPFGAGKKRKSPSHRRRDRERFRKFLENKKSAAKLKTNSKQIPKSEEPVPTQCPAPVDVSIAVGEPPTVTVTSPLEPLVRPAQNTSHDTSSSQSDTSSDEEPCTCENCEEFKDNCDKEPYSDLKDACEWILCRKLATETDLKTCTRCNMVAYCSKKCQARDWSVHKDYCKQVDAS